MVASKQKKFCPKNALYRTSRVPRPVVIPNGTERMLMTQTILSFDDQVVVTCVEISDQEGIPLFDFGAAMLCSFDPLAHYRLYRLISEVPNISREIIQAAVVISLQSDTTSMSDDEDVGPILRLIPDLLGRDRFDAIMLEFPPDLDALLPTLIDGGYPLNVTCLVREVERGRLEPTPYQRSYGIDHPEVVKRRDALALQQVEALRPIFLQCIGRAHRKDCDHVQRLLHCAAQCHIKGITDPAEVLGLSLVRMSEGMVPILFADPRLYQHQLIAAVAKLAIHYSRHRGSEHALADRLTALRREWSKMPCVM